jgi:hypothetical protein
LPAEKKKHAPPAAAAAADAADDEDDAEDDEAAPGSDELGSSGFGAECRKRHSSPLEQPPGDAKKVHAAASLPAARRCSLCRKAQAAPYRDW